MCIAGGKRCKYSDALSNVRKKTKSRLRHEGSYIQEQAIIEAVKEFRENNSDLVTSHLPAKMGFQVTPPARPIPHSLLSLMGSKKDVITGVSLNRRDEFYSDLHQRRELWHALLDEEEQDALMAYTMSGFEAMNAHLRRRGYGTWSREHGYLRQGESMQSYLEEFVKPRIAGLDSAFKKAPAPDAPEKLYRYFKVPDGVHATDYVKKYFPVGGGYKDRGFASTSADPEFLTAHIMGNSKGTRNKGYVVLEILTSAGVSFQPKPRPNSGHLQSLEAEVALPRNTGMRIVETGIRKFEFGKARPDLTQRFNSSHAPTVTFMEGVGCRLPVIRMIDERLIRQPPE